jgi:hypothetical protein
MEFLQFFYTAAFLPHPFFPELLRHCARFFKPFTSSAG